MLSQLSTFPPVYKDDYNIVNSKKDEIDYISYSFLPKLISLDAHNQVIYINFEYTAPESKDSKERYSKNHFGSIIVGKYTKKILTIKIPYKDSDQLDNAIEDVIKLLRQEENIQLNLSAKKHYQLIRYLLKNLVSKIKDEAFEN